MVGYYSVYQLNQLDKQLISIYLLCFVYHRYQKLHDNLIHCFIYHIRRYLEESKQVAKERVYTYRLEHNANLSKAGQVLKLFTDDTIGGSTPFEQVRGQAFAILERLQLEMVATYIVQKTHFDETLFQWEHIETMARRFKHRLRPLLKAIDFHASVVNEPLLTAINFLRMTWQKKNAHHQHKLEGQPIHFIPNSIKRYLYVTDKEGHKHLHPDRYEFLVYRLLRNSLEAGHIFCRDSIRFRSFEDDLVDDTRWQQKETLFANLELPMLNMTATEQLYKLKQQLEERLQIVNQRIVTGDATGRLLFNMLGAIAQFETEIRAERQRDGIYKAKEQGVKFGKRKQLKPQQIAELQRQRQQGVLITTLMKQYRLSKSTIYRYLAESLSTFQE